MVKDVAVEATKMMTKCGRKNKGKIKKKQIPTNKFKLQYWAHDRWQGKRKEKGECPQCCNTQPFCHSKFLQPTLFCLFTGHSLSHALFHTQIIHS
jgi:hypothetical protein